MLFYQKPLTRRMYVCYTSYATGDDYMMKITKGYVFRMYPNEKQINLIEKSLDVVDLYIIIS